MGRSTRSTRRTAGDASDARSFVQVAQRPSLGVEISTGRAWVGVDQQVGHGSADALFALTEDAAEGQAAFREKRKPNWSGR